MAQGALKSNGGKKKATAANRHGKIIKNKKGRLDKPVKRPQLKKQSIEDKELTKAINAGNESRVAGVAASSGGKLSVLKAPIAATATADQKNKAKGAKLAKPMRPGMAFGASSK